MKWTPLALVLLVTALVWASALGAGFVFDDNLFWLRAPCWQISSWADLPAVPASPGCGYRKLRYLSLAVDHLLWRDWAAGYHLTNICLHLATTALVWAFLVRWTTRPWLAAATTLLWSVHPVHTDVVTYVSGRRDLLAAVFFIAALVAWPRTVQGVRSAGRIALALGCFVLAVLSKEMAVTLPAVLLLVIFAAHRRLGEPVDDAGAMRMRLVKLAPAIGIGMAIAAWTVIQRGILHPLTDTTALHGASLGAHIGSVLAAYGRYAELLVFPVRLYGDYSDFRVAQSLLEVRALPGLLLLAGCWIGGGILLFRAKTSAVGAGLLFFAITLLPVSQLIPHHELLAEHYLYIPAVGLALALTAAAELLLSRRPVLTRPLVALVGLVILLFTLRIQLRNAEYEDETTFAAAIVHHVPHSFRGRRSLANGLARRGDLRGATALFEEMLADFRAGGNEHAALAADLAQVLAASGHLERAETLLRSSLTALPDNDEALSVLGSVLLQTGRADEAIPYLRQSLELYPNMAQRRVWLAMALAQTGQADQALVELSTAERFAPADPMLQMAAGDILAAQGRLPEAWARYERVRRLDPNAPAALMRMAAILEATGDAAGASALRRQAEALPQ